MKLIITWIVGFFMGICADTAIDAWNRRKWRKSQKKSQYPPIHSGYDLCSVNQKPRINEIPSDDATSGSFRANEATKE